MIAKLNSADAIHKSVDLLLSLHRLALVGQSQTEEADRLRDQMETPWYAMSAEDQARVDGLSADLYSIGRGGIASTDLKSPENLADEMRELTANGDWDGILKQVRKYESSLPQRDIACARAICWAHLGFPSVAIEFFNEAARLRNLTANEEALLLTCYVHAERASEVLVRAQEIQAKTQHPLLLLKAAEIFSLLAEDSAAENAAKYRQVAIDCAERAIATENDESHSLVLSGFLHLALNYEQLGNHDKAIEACRSALKIFPTDADALMLYGFLVFDNYSNSDRSEFIHSRRGQFIGASFDRLLASPGLSPLTH